MQGWTFGIAYIAAASQIQVVTSQSDVLWQLTISEFDAGDNLALCCRYRIYFGCSPRFDGFGNFLESAAFQGVSLLCSGLEPPTELEANSHVHPCHLHA